MNFLKAFVEDCRYYDRNQVELKSILKNVNLKNKRVIDIGAGIGRLSFPLSKYAKEIVALDNDKRFVKYYKKHKKKNLIFINKDASKYLNAEKQFDIFIIAWPTINFKFINLLKKSVLKDSVIIFITCDNTSDFETIVDKLELFDKEKFKNDIMNKKKFIKKIEKNFKLIKKEKIKTEYLYPNKKIALKNIKNYLKLWFNITLKKKAQLRLIKIIDDHTLKNNQIKFEEKIFFMILK